MRFSLSTLVFAASLAVAGAQDLTGIPDCALTCFATAVPASGCSITDTKCQCTTGQESITNDLLSCVPAKCSAEDLAKVAPAVQKLCANAGVTVSNLPTSVTGSATASPTASTTGASSSASGSNAPAQSTGGAIANSVGMGAAALGFAAVFL